MVAKGLPGVGMDFIAEPGRETDGAKQAEVVLGEAFVRVADTSDDAVLDILPAADEVDDLSRGRILEESVDGEVAAVGVAFGRGEMHRLGPAAVLVVIFLAKGGDLVLGSAPADEHDAEVRADALGFGKDLGDLGGEGRGGYVIVVRGLSEQPVANAAAGEVSCVPRLGELAGDAQRAFPEFVWIMGRFHRAEVDGRLVGGACGAGILRPIPLAKTTWCAASGWKSGSLKCHHSRT